MELLDLRNKEIKNIFYEDEFGGIGELDSSNQVHFIEFGNIYLEFTDNSIVEILNDNERKGIVVNTIDDSIKVNIEKNRIENDKFWNPISNKLILEINIFKDSLIEEIGKAVNEIRLISTIEIIFKHGERIFISNAGYISKKEIQGMTDDFIIYKKRIVGQELGLIN